MKKCCEYIRGIRCKLFMMGIEVDGPAYNFGDNKFVFCNTVITKSMLENKFQSNAHHLVRE